MKGEERTERKPKYAQQRGFVFQHASACSGNRSFFTTSFRKLKEHNRFKVIFAK